MEGTHVSSVELAHCIVRIYRVFYCSCRTEVRQSIGTARVAVFILPRLYKIRVC